MLQISFIENNLNVENWTLIIFSHERKHKFFWLFKTIRVDFKLIY